MVALLAAPGGLAKGATSRTKLRDVHKGKLGTTLWLDLDRAPFPAPNSPYTDPTVIVFVPSHYRVPSTHRVDAVMHFHGWRDSAEQAMTRHGLREQLAASKQNAILVIPQGPVEAEDSAGGKLDEEGGLSRLLTEIRKELQTVRLQAQLGPAAIPKKARMGRLVLSAHSGGYRVLANCLEKGGYNASEVYLFDALYARADTFRDWVAVAAGHRDHNRHKLVSYYSGDELARHNHHLMRELERLGVEVLHEESEGTLSRRQMLEGRAIFIRSRSTHQGMVHEHNELRDLLFSSCLDRRLKADWFKDPERPRPRQQRRAKP
jgi:hypothetical protein